MKQLTYLASAIIVLLQACNNKDINPGVVISDELREGVIQDDFNGSSLAVYAHSQQGLMVAYNRKLSDSSIINLSRSSLDFPDVFESEDGTIWNIHGEAVSGPKQGSVLTSMRGQIGYWFSFATFFPIVSIMGSPEQEPIDNSYSDAEWLIDPNNVYQGAIKDGIPSIESPKFVTINQSSSVSFIQNHELVSVLKNGSTIKVYPHKILNWHEIVNDDINGESVTVSFCPLTGTSDVWNRTIDGGVTTFGVSGFLYNNNLILYDRATDSLWPQILKRSVFGNKIGDEVEPLALLEMTWESARLLSNNIQLLTDETGFARNYNNYPYGNYRDADGLLYPITYTDSRIFSKERVLHIQVNGKSKVYQFANFELK